MTNGTRKEHCFRLTLTDEALRRFLEQVYVDGTTPAEVLEGFINDLTASDYNHGSDERELATRYYDRCGYPYITDDSPRFYQYLLSEYHFEEVVEAIDDKEDAERELAYCKAFPEAFETDKEKEEHTSVYEDLLEQSEETIADAYKEYTSKAEKPEALEDAIKGVRECWNNMKKIEEGGLL